MKQARKFPISLIIPILFIGVAISWWQLRNEPTAPGPDHAAAPESDRVVTPYEAPASHFALARLGRPPDWDRLSAFQGSITRQQFRKALDEVYTLGESWRPFIRIHEDHALIATGSETPAFELQFSEEEMGSPPPRQWRAVKEIPPPSEPDKKLQGMRIAIDPGHIGGAFAEMEGRHFRIADSPPVREGEMTLKVAKLLQTRLQKLGATVFLVREHNRPLTQQRPVRFTELAKGEMPASASAEEIQRRADLYFYRVSEIRARADRLLEKFQPDLTLCLHFNAEAWGDPEAPDFVDDNHFHLLLNGAYSQGELTQVDQRFEMLKRLLERCHESESALGHRVARKFAEDTGLPAFTYSESAPAIAGDNRYVWRRNLLANRIYPGPVLYFEPYVMNHQSVYERVLLGDYEGTREHRGRAVKSIFREYADAVTDGLVQAVTELRDTP